MTDPLTSMVSYSWDDANAAELIHEELALRGLTVFHDRCTFPSGSRIGQNMADAVDRCDSFVAYLTPASLYETRPTDTPRPAIDDEFIPVMDRLARVRSLSAPSVPQRPVVVALTHGLGDPRIEAPARVWKATGRDISSLWTPVALDQTTPSVLQHEAAAAAHGVLQALLAPGAGGAVSDPIQLVVVTRGEGQTPGFLTIDATRLLGGRTSRPGSSEDWNRFLAGARDLQATLSAWSPQRQLSVRLRAHLTAAIALGRVFNQAANWWLVVEGRYGDAAPSDADAHPRLKTSLDKGARRDDLAIEIDLLDVRVSSVAAATLASLPDPVPNRLCIWRDGRGDIGPSDIAAMASAAATAVRDAVFDLQPDRAHIFCAAPVEFAALLGRKLTSLHCDLLLYERDDGVYTPSLVIPRSMP
jgi:SMODS-associated and fused to various effectors sensor domain/TIR domain